MCQKKKYEKIPKFVQYNICALLLALNLPTNYAAENPQGSLFQGLQNTSPFSNQNITNSNSTIISYSPATLKLHSLRNESLKNIKNLSKLKSTTILASVLGNFLPTYDTTTSKEVNDTSRTNNSEDTVLHSNETLKLNRSSSSFISNLNNETTVSKLIEDELTARIENSSTVVSLERPALSVMPKNINIDSKLLNLRNKNLDNSTTMMSTKLELVKNFNGVETFSGTDTARTDDPAIWNTENDTSVANNVITNSEIIHKVTKTKLLLKNSTLSKSASKNANFSGTVSNLTSDVQVALTTLSSDYNFNKNTNTKTETIPTQPTLHTVNDLSATTSKFSHFLTETELLHSTIKSEKSSESANVKATTELPYSSLETETTPETHTLTTNSFIISTDINEMALSINSYNGSDIHNSKGVTENFTLFVDHNSLESTFDVHNITTNQDKNIVKVSDAAHFGMANSSIESEIDTFASTLQPEFNKNKANETNDKINLSSNFDLLKKPYSNSESYEILSETRTSELSELIKSMTSTSFSSAIEITPTITTEQTTESAENEIHTSTSASEKSTEQTDNFDRINNRWLPQYISTNTEKTLSSSTSTDSLKATKLPIDEVDNLPIYSTTLRSVIIENRRDDPLLEKTTRKNVSISTKTFSLVTPTGNASTRSNVNVRSDSDIDMNIIVAMCVGIIGIIATLLTLAFVYILRKRHKQLSYTKRCRPVSLDAYSLDNISAYNSVRRKGTMRCSKRSYGNVAFDDPLLRHNILNVADLKKFSEKRSTIYEEFRNIPQVTVRPNEVPRGCEEKNRYANVVPLPETRVILLKKNNDEKSEYINANYVRGPKDTPNYYIACQGPLQHTVGDFWRMVWEQNSRVIIMATDLMENGIEKCAEYLPPSITIENQKVYGDYQVTLKNREIRDKFALSTIILKNNLSNDSRELVHFWYKWPETGAPTDDNTVIKMLLEARTYLKLYAAAEMNASRSNNNLSLNDFETSDHSTSAKKEMKGNILPKNSLSPTTMQSPLIVHCSPGTGRTGTIIACDIAIRSLESPKRSVDIPQIVYYIRRGRAIAVQTKEQYEFIYKVAGTYATNILNTHNDS